MTIKELEEIGEIWYQRTYRLREIYLDQRQSDYRRGKAFLLFYVMQKRVLAVSMELSKALQPMPPKNFEKGELVLNLPE